MNSQNKIRLLLFCFSTLLAALMLANDASSQQASDKADAAKQHPPNYYLKIDKHVVPPQPLYTPQPEKVVPSGKVKTRGTVVLWVGINEQGTIDTAKVVRSLNRKLDESALETVKKWKFIPATKDGKPTPVQTNVEVNFALSE
jgi:TonB family protein